MVPGAPRRPPAQRFIARALGQRNLRAGRTYTFRSSLEQLCAKYVPCGALNPPGTQKSTPTRSRRCGARRTVRSAESRPQFAFKRRQVGLTASCQGSSDNHMDELQTDSRLWLVATPPTRFHVEAAFSAESLLATSKTSWQLPNDRIVRAGVGRDRG